jgi:bifunctional non-homologous end joining protein LigD
MSPSLDKYRAKRDFDATPEPSDLAPSERDASAGDHPRFVVQEHHARALHWDFRLEREGVLVSWALPKGVPLDPKVNHLAVPTEDHPLSYIDFEGEIPRGNYGAGHVHLWDRGTYDTIKWSDREVMVELHGERVRGRHVLFRTGDRQWMIHRMDPPQDPGFEALPDGWSPMWARSGELPDDEGSWSFEVAWPGRRVLASIDGGRVRVVAGALDMTERVPELRALGRAVGARPALLDGVLVGIGSDGRPDRDLVARRLDGTHKPPPPLVLMLVDVLHLDGHPSTPRPFHERRAQLEDLALAGPAWQTPAAHVGAGAALVEAARAQGLGGVIAKRLDSPYVPGTVSDAWIELRI